MVYALASSLSLAGRVEEAVQLHRRAIALQPNMHEAHSNLGLCHLLRGEFELGWELFEWRWKSTQMRGWANFPAPLWSGDDLGSRIILVWAEQGLGDSIQFVRYLAVLRENYPQCELVFWGPQTLSRLFESFAKQHNISFIARESAPIPANISGMDCHVPLMSLPRLLHTRMETIPTMVPGYLDINPDWVQPWCVRVAALGTESFISSEYSANRAEVSTPLNVGIVWSGLLEGIAVAKRNIPLQVLEPLLDIPGIRWFSLQMGEKQVAQVKGTRWEGRLIDWTSGITDFADTASLVLALDMVITVDTSTAHAAAAAGAPVWMLSRFDGCWRWLQEREDSPWYPTMRLFRQQKPSDWISTVNNVAAALQQLNSDKEHDNNKEKQQR